MSYPQPPASPGTGALDAMAVIGGEGRGNEASTVDASHLLRSKESVCRDHTVPTPQSSRVYVFLSE